MGPQKLIGAAGRNLSCSRAVGAPFVLGIFMKSFYATALCAALCVAASVALADPFDNAGFYANVGAGRFHGERISSDEITGRLGARFGDYFGVEGELSVGLGEHRFVYSPPCTHPICPLYIFAALLQTKLEHAEAAYAVGYLPVLPNADLFARVGYGTSHYAIKGAIGRDFDPQGLQLGAGAQYFLDEANGLRFDYTHSDLESDNFFGKVALGKNLDSWTISYTRSF